MNSSSAPSPVPALHASCLVKDYGKARVLELEQLSVELGHVRVLVGPNGAGKTTALRLIAGLEPATSGQLMVLGRAWGESSAGDLALRRRIGFVTQRPYLFKSTARRNVEYPLRSRGIGRSEASDRAARAMKQLGLLHLAERRARSLSAGESQRMALARAVVARPELLLLDEPLANIDPENTAIVEQLLRDLASGGVTILVATHVVNLAYHLSAEVVRLERGHRVAPAVENLLGGNVVDGPEGSEPFLQVESGQRITVATDRRGPVRAVIEPRDIVVSTESFHSSARNSLPGRVVGIEDRGAAVRITADVGVKLVATVTHESVSELGLTIGSQVHYTFKATSLKVF